MITVPATANAAPPGGPRPIALKTLPGDTTTSVTGVNDQGVIVGWGQGDTGPAHAIRWSPSGRPSELSPLPGGTYSEAYGINNRGDIVGESAYADGIGHAVRWNARGVITDLGTLPPRNEGTSADGINDRGVIVGYAPIKAKTVHAVEWQPDGAITDIGVTSPLGSSQANAVNDRGFVVGQSFEIGPSHDNLPVEWSPSGVLTALPTLPDWPYGYAQDINDSDVAVGVVQVGDTSNGRALDAAAWTRRGGTAVLAILPGGTGMSANGVDDRGVIVGDAASSAGYSVPVFWYPTAASWRMGQLPLLPGYVGGDTVAINDRGDEVIGDIYTASGQGGPVYWKR